MTEPEQTPAQALEAIRQSRNQVRETVRDQKGASRYALIYSAIAAVMVGGQVLSMPLNVLCSAGGAVALALLARSWSQRTGVWVSGVTPGKARWVAIGLGALMLALMLAAVWAGQAGRLWAGLPLGALAFFLAWGGSVLWVRVFLAETRDR
ncbi:hypothetical protein BH09PSE1_BH09PSE1_27960 [soil metagenome]